jgi:hypothetical protein
MRTARLVVLCLLAALCGDAAAQVRRAQPPQPRASHTADLASMAANVCAADATVTVAGAALGAECVAGGPATLNAGAIVTCFVSAANTVKLRVCNSTTGALDLPSLTYTVRVFNP